MGHSGATSVVGETALIWQDQHCEHMLSCCACSVVSCGTLSYTYPTYPSLSYWRAPKAGVSHLGMNLWGVVPPLTALITGEIVPTHVDVTYSLIREQC